MRVNCVEQVSGARDKSRHQRQAFQRQQEIVTELAATHGLEIKADDVIAEYGSGSEFVGRPGLMNLLRRVEGGQMRAVVMMRLEALTRSANSEDAQAVFQTLLDHKIQVITETDMFHLARPLDAAHCRLACELRTEQAAPSDRGRRRTVGG